MKNVLVVGGGIAGTEAALWLARTLPDAAVSVVTKWPALRLSPNLVYVPFDVSARRVDISLAEPFEQLGIGLVEHEAERVDPETRTVSLSDGSTLEYDALVIAPGVEPIPGGDGLPLRTLDHAHALRDALSALPADTQASVLVRVAEDNAWTAPAYEFALLLAAWREATGRTKLDVALATPEREPFTLFNLEASELVRDRANAVGVSVLAGVPRERMDDLEANVYVDFDALRARKVTGAGTLDAHGFYAPDAEGRMSRDVFVVGDAANLAYKAAFATSWQARRVVRALGGDPRSYGEQVGSVPVGECEYQMDLGDGTLHVRFDAGRHFRDPFLDSRAEVWTSDDSPDKLEGTLVKDLLLGDEYEHQVSRRFRDLLAATGS